MPGLRSVRLIGLASLVLLSAPLLAEAQQPTRLIGAALGLAQGSDGFTTRASLTFSHRVGDFSLTSVESSREISSSRADVPGFLVEFETLDEVVTDYSLLYGRHLGESLRGWARLAAGPSLVRSSLRSTHCGGVFIAIDCDRNSQSSSWTLGLASQLDLLAPLGETHALGLMLSGNLNGERSFGSAGIVYQLFLGF